MTTERNENERLDALVALRSLPGRRVRGPAARAQLLAAAWASGERNISRLAELAGVHRGTVYSDLRAQGIDPTDRRGAGRPAGAGRVRYAPMNADDVREAADLLGAAVLPASLTETMDPLTTAAFHAHVALLRVAELLDSADTSPAGRLVTYDDLAARADLVRASANELMGQVFAPAELAAHTEQDAQNRCLVEASISSLTATVSCPDGSQLTVSIGTADHRAPIEGWTTWSAAGAHELGPMDGRTHLDLTDAVNILAGALTRALPDEAFEER